MQLKSLHGLCSCVTLVEKTVKSISSRQDLHTYADPHTHGTCNDMVNWIDVRRIDLQTEWEYLHIFDEFSAEWNNFWPFTFQ